MPGGALSLTDLAVIGPAGRIEAFLKQPAGRAAPPVAAAIVCHPHPLFGGTMHNKVVHAAAMALSRAEIPVARFNFRGVGLSEGKYDEGRGEQEDLRAVLGAVTGLMPGAQLLVCGYSFGAWVGLRVGCADPRVAALIGIGLPVGLFSFEYLRACTKPLALIQGDQDRFGPLPLLMGMAAGLPGGARVLPVRGASHGFEGRLEELGRRVSEAIPESLLPSPGPRPASGHPS